MNRIFLFAAILLQYTTHAQTSKGVVSGAVVDKALLNPIEFATAELFRVQDSSLVTATATDKKGNFSITGVLAGNYYIRCSFIGYEKAYSDSFFLDTNGHFSIARLELIATTSTLADVTVTGTKPQLSASIDRKVYNVEQDIMSRSGTASDILRNIPSIEVDVEGNVSLRGSGDVTILINGRPNPLMGRTRAEVLQQLPANSIERIEVITNPSARYRPDGTSGIINIVLKKNVRNGFNGSATINAGNKDRYNGALGLNYRPKHWNLFGSFSFRKDTRPRYYTNDRTYPGYSTGSAKSLFRQVINSLAHSNAHIATAGFDYAMNDKNSFGLSGNIFYRRLLRKDDATYLTLDNTSVLTEDFTRFRYDPEFEQHLNATVFYQHNFGKPEHNLRIEGNIPSEVEQEDNHYTNIYRKPSSLITYDNTKIDQRTRNNQLTVDYSSRLAEDTKLEAGYDGSYNKTNVDYYNEFFNPSQRLFVKDATKSNQFDYNESVHALYGTYQKAFKKLGYEVGLRTEAVFTKGHLVNLDSFVRNDYFKVYPTVHLLYRLSESSELQLNYSKRVNRPDGDKLNPFPEYKDPLNLRAGNPKLLPEVIHSVKAGYKWQKKGFSIVPSLYYRYKIASFTSVVVPLNDSVLLTTTQNLSNDQSAGLELILSAKAKFLTASLGGNLFYNRIDAANLGYIQNKSIYSASFNFVTSFMVTKTTFMQVSGSYRSAKLTPQGKTFPNFVLNAGMRQELGKNKWSLTLTGSDLFSALNQKTELNMPSLKQVSVSRRDGLIAYVGISYRFGIIKKGKDEKLQYDNSL